MTTDLSNKRVITAALTGAIHTPSMSPHLPITPEELIKEAVAAHAAGAAVVGLFTDAVADEIRKAVRSIEIRIWRINEQTIVMDYQHPMIRFLDERHRQWIPIRIHGHVYTHHLVVFEGSCGTVLGEG